MMKVTIVLRWWGEEEGRTVECVVVNKLVCRGQVVDRVGFMVACAWGFLVTVSQILERCPVESRACIRSSSG